jgi:hypothetical protein
METHIAASIITWLSSIFSVIPDWLWVLFAAHMVNTMPTPKSVWLQWMLGGVKWLVGQRVSAINAFNGLQTEVTAVTTEQKKALANGSEMKVIKTDDGLLHPVSQATNERYKGDQ